MNKTSRRKFLQVSGAATVMALSGCVSTTKSASGRVIVVGGGFGGATAARYIRNFDSAISVTLIEPKTSYTTCPFSNAYLGGLRNLQSITHNYKGLAKHGVNVVHDHVVAVDPVKRNVTTRNGGAMGYDRLIMAPGIDFRFEETPGSSAAAAAKQAPHAWKGGSQTVLLRKQLQAMDDGGLVIICPPGNPFRCPPGPYERASMIAHYLKTHKPRSKVLILDRKDKFSKQGAFTEGWNTHYKNYIEWVPLSKGGAVSRINAASGTVTTDFDTHKAAVLNFIPNQKAGAIAFTAGLTNKSGWCPVNLKTFESTIHAGIHVIGDAAIVTGMPKSGNAANSEAKACAAAVVNLLRGETPGTPITSNTCYSLITPDYGISVTAVWESSPGGYKKKSGGVSPGGRDANFRKQEAQFARGWYKNIITDVWG